MKSTEEPQASPPSSVALCSARRARHIPPSNAIMHLMFQLADVGALVGFHFIPVPGTVSGTQ